MIFIYSEGLLETSQIKIILRSAGNLTTKRGPFRINFERQGPKGWLAYGLT
jgi:hypothetical protein